MMGEVSRYRLNLGLSPEPAGYLGYELAETVSYTYDGSRLWALITYQGDALAPVNYRTGSVDIPLGPCGDEVAWDGDWFWLLTETQLRAYDVNGKFVAQAHIPDGYRLRYIAASNGRVVVSAERAGKNYLLLLQR